MSPPPLIAAGKDGEFEKTIKKEFPLSISGTLEISSRYGAVNITSWDRQEVSMEIRIVANANSQQSANELFERVKTSFTNTGDSRVSASVVLEPVTTVTGWIFKSTRIDYRADDIKIYWEIKMPAAAELISETKYCNLSLPDRSGKNELTIRHGNLSAGNLSGRSRLNLSYGNGRAGKIATESELTLRYGKFNCSATGDFRYDGRYSHFRTETADRIKLDIGYDNVTIGKAVSVEIDGSYNDVVIKEVGDLQIDGNYGDYEIGLITGSVDVDARYGDLEIDQLAAGFREVDIDVGYIDVELEIERGAGYSIDLSARYGDIEFADDDRLTNRKRQKENYTQSLSGTIAGKGSGTIRITTSYGDIEID